MDREQAAQALQMLQRVVAQARDDTALENWGLIWVCSAFSNTAGFFATQWLFSSGHRAPWPYAGLWVLVLLVNGGFIAAFKRGGAARVRTFVERQVWALWTALVLAMGLAAVVNYLLGLDRLFMPAVASLLTAFTFAAMGSAMGSVWFAPAVGWTLFSLVMAALPRWQFALFGVAWFLTQFTGGALLHRARLRRERGGAR